MNIKYYINKAKDVHWKDALSFFPMLSALICLPFCRSKYRNTWGISERKDEARDNGYHFFKYMTQSHPEQKCFYTIDPECSDFSKVRDLGETVRFGSVKHWILYFSCEYLISSQRFLPNAYMGTLIERMGLAQPRHVFLQHGITINKPEYLRADRWPVSLFITAADQETESIKEHLGFADHAVKLTGFARFDALHDFQVVKNRIMIMPTWRKWLRFRSEKHSDVEDDLMSSDYILRWRELFESRELKELIDTYGLEVIFIPHPNMKGILDPEKLAGEHVRTVDLNTVDLQEIMKTSEMIITDYSSVFFDMAYMKKPTVFYQFDEENFRKYHYEEGWFRYRDSAFGEVCTSARDVTDALRKHIQNNYQITPEFEAEHRKTFSLFDTRNSERIYQAIKSLKETEQ